MDPEDIMLSGISQTEGRGLCDFTEVRFLEESHSWREKAEWRLSVRGCKEGAAGTYLMGTEFCFGVMKKFWRWVVMVVV